VVDFTISGLPSPDMDQALLDFTTILLTDYSDLFSLALPLVFNDFLRTMLNDALYKYRTSDDACPIRAASSNFSTFDFRDWFLSDLQQAKALGGTGLKPYGDLVSSLWNLITDVALDVDPKTGLSSLLNDVLLAPLLSTRQPADTVNTNATTRSSQTITGVWDIPTPLVDVDSTVQVGGLSAIARFLLDNVRLEQLDSVGAPISLLNPIASHAHHLNNTATLGLGGRPVRFAFRLLFGLVTDGNGTLSR
jgi:hypothetical protein